MTFVIFGHALWHSWGCRLCLFTMRFGEISQQWCMLLDNMAGGGYSDLFMYVLVFTDHIKKRRTIIIPPFNYKDRYAVFGCSVYNRH